MYLCYLDESGVPEIPGNSTHFVLAGIAIPIERWREADAAISEIMARHGLAGAELHTAWLLRKYLEQSRIDGFDEMNWDERRAQVARLRVAEVHRVRKLGIAKRNAQLKKVYRHTDPYVHLTLSERNRLAHEIAETISKWDWAVLIASCVDKSFFLTKGKPNQVNASAFSIVVVQFAELLQQAENLNRIVSGTVPPQDPVREFGLLIHDNNPTVALKHTGQLRAIRENEISARHGIFDRIIETPLFVDSGLTRMIQLADLWGYSLRRYVENGDSTLFSILYSKQRTMIGRIQHPAPRARVDHFAENSCECLICTNSGIVEK
ncbi:MAG: DUF3800 domain-containing protein [Terracidiphilus sp.]|nr:DUF3800 domain-containing protein [Terracidiphilus sp.]